MIDHTVSQTFLEGVNRDSNREVNGELLAGDKPEFKGTDTAEVQLGTRAFIPVDMDIERLRKLARQWNKTRGVRVVATVRAKGRRGMNVASRTHLTVSREEVELVQAALLENGIAYEPYEAS